MATLTGTLVHVKAHLQRLVPSDQIRQTCRNLGHIWRDRTLGPDVTVHLFLLQLLAGVALSGLRHVAAIPASAQAICRAKMRLPLQLLMEQVAASAPDGPERSLWRGLAVYLADAMSFMTQDTAALAARYGKPRNQRGTSMGYPTPKLLALMDFGGGFIRRVIALPWARQEFTCLSRLFKAIGSGALLLGDRGLVSFAHLALLMRANVAGCFRLPRGQVVHKHAPKRRASSGGAKGGRRAKHASRSRRLISRLGPQDLLVRWTAARRPAWLGRRRWAALAAQPLTLRQIAFRICRPGHRPRWAWIITTLIDPRRYPAGELIKLYGKRWQIEVYFRDLKRTLGLRLISAKTPEGVRKEILAFILLYNLIRGVMQKAAQRQGVEPRRISFIDAMRWLLWSSPGTPLPDLLINPPRTRAAPPRRLKNARHRFPQLNKPRARLNKPPCHVML